jgi:hypothetical protein
VHVTISVSGSAQTVIGSVSTHQKREPLREPMHVLRINAH